jgi:catalase-peroxidase
MGMSDFETVALIAGGHTFGKAHGAADPSKYVGAEPEGAPINQMGLGWKNSFLSGKGKDTITSGLEGAWTANPTIWDSGYFHLLFKYDWTQSKSPGGATQWVTTMDSINANGGIDVVANVPDAHVQGMKHLPIMFTTDLALRYDPIYGPISEEFHLNQDKFTDAFKRAWYKLCHRDMGPTSRHLGPYLPNESLIWLDPIPSADYDAITSNDVQHLQNLILDMLDQSVSISDLVKAAWASASTYRVTDHRGGANGGRIRLDPQINWEANDPVSLARVVSMLEKLKESFNNNQKKNNSKTRVSFADLIILAGNTAIEAAARKAGHMNVKVPFVPGRTDALQSDTDVVSSNALQPSMDGFRNYEGKEGRPEASLVDRAHLMTLTTPEMVVLIGGLRVLNANTDQQSLVGVLTDRPGTLDNEYFINLLDENTTWSPVGDGKFFRGNRPTGEPWIASRVDLVLGSNAQLRAVCEAYACADSGQYFLHDFVSSWTKVTMLDRFDLIPAALSRRASKL